MTRSKIALVLAVLVAALAAAPAASAEPRKNVRSFQIIVLE